MARRRKRDRKAQAKPPPEDGTERREQDGPPPDDRGRVCVGEWSEQKPPVWRSFPGPRDVDVPLRVAFEREAHAEVMAHGKGSLEAEVCGVLVGRVCEDDDGVFVHVEAAIRGSAAKGGGGHVTFTQETWSAIHQSLETDFPKLQIVGWYHSHPGFGVAFSDMDLFIQENFFPAPTQVALVVDPVSGDEAVCVNTADGVRGIGRFWIDGRERQCQVLPGSPGEQPPEEAGAPGDADASLRAIQAKLNQLIQAFDEEHAGVYRILLILGMVIAFAVVLWIGSSIYLSYIAARYEPPRSLKIVSGQIRVGEKTVVLGIPVVEWEVPPQMDLERENRKLREANAELKRLIREALAAKEAEAEGARGTESQEPPHKP